MRGEEKERLRREENEGLRKGGEGRIEGGGVISEEGREGVVLVCEYVALVYVGV